MVKSCDSALALARARARQFPRPSACSACVHGGSEVWWPRRVISKLERRGNERRRTCTVAMSGSARIGAAMDGPGRQWAEMLGFERKQAE